MNLRYIILLILLIISTILFYNKVTAYHQQTSETWQKLSNKIAKNKIKIYISGPIGDPDFKTCIGSFLGICFVNLFFCFEKIYRDEEGYFYIRKFSSETLRRLFECTQTIYLRSNYASFAVFICEIFNFAVFFLFHSLNKIFNKINYRNVVLVFTNDFYYGLLKMVIFLIVVPFLFTFLNVFLIYLAGNFLDRDKLVKATTYYSHRVLRILERISGQRLMGRFSENDYVLDGFALADWDVDSVNTADGLQNEIRRQRRQAEGQQEEQEEIIPEDLKNNTYLLIKEKDVYDEFVMNSNEIKFFEDRKKEAENKNPKTSDNDGTEALPNTQ